MTGSTSLQPATQMVAKAPQLRSAMKGFHAEFKNLDDYIRVITDRIWEGRRIDDIHLYYSDPCVVETAMSVSTSIESVVTGTRATLAMFPDRRLLAEDVIQSGDEDGGFLSSHRIISPMTHLGDGTFGKATGSKVNAVPMQFNHHQSYRQPVPADPLRHSRRNILASILLLLDSDRALADWSLPQLPHVSGFTYKGNRFLVATMKEVEQIVWGWIENNLWAVSNTDEDIDLLLQHLQISPSLIEALNGQATLNYLRTVHPRKFCKLLSPAIANPTQFVQALFENRSRPGLVKRAICESAQFSPLAWTEVERAGYLIYCIVNQPEVLPGSIKLTINYPYPYKPRAERA